jgi:arsenate reductase
MKVLFMCTANSCRSILSEAVFNQLAPAGLQAVSAGSQPGGRVNPRALQTLRNAGIACDGLSSKGAEAFAAAPPDVVITVCDQAAAEACPAWFGPAIKAHWGLADPSDVRGDEAAIDAAFEHTLAIIRRRCEVFFAVQPLKLSTEQLGAALQQIGAVQ